MITMESYIRNIDTLDILENDFALESGSILMIATESVDFKKVIIAIKEKINMLIRKIKAFFNNKMIQNRSYNGEIIFIKRAYDEYVICSKNLTKKLADVNSGNIDDSKDYGQLKLKFERSRSDYSDNGMFNASAATVSKVSQIKTILDRLVSELNALGSEASKISDNDELAKINNKISILNQKYSNLVYLCKNCVYVKKVKEKKDDTLKIKYSKGSKK